MAPTALSSDSPVAARPRVCGGSPSAGCRWTITALLLLAVVAAGRTTGAATFTYSALAGTNPGLLWSDGANWVGGVVPTFDDQADLIFNVVNPVTNMRIGANRIVRSMVFGATQNASATVVGTRADANTNARTLTLQANTGNAKIEQASGFPGSLLRIGTNNEGDVILASSVDVYANSPTAPIQFDSIVTGAGAINKYGVGMVTATRANTFAGGINIIEGVFEVFAAAAAAGSGTISIGGVNGAEAASLGLSTTQTRSNAITVNAGAGGRTIYARTSTSSGGNPTQSGVVTLNKDTTIDVSLITAGTQDRLTLSGAVTGAGGIVKTGTGILILSGSGNDYSGTTDIQAGKFYLGGAGRLGSGAVTIASGANLDFGTGASQINVVANNISGGGQIIQSTASTDTRFTGAVTNTGGLSILNGTVRIGNSGTTGSYTGDTAVSSGATIAFSRSDDYTYAGTISGDGGMSKVSAGTLTLTGSNSYSGNTALFTGALVADHANALGTGNITFNAAGGGGTLRYTAASAGTDWATRIVNSNAAIRLDTNGNDVSLAGAIASTNTNGLVKSGSGVLTLGGANAYSGTTTVSAGTLRVNGNQSAATGAVSVASGATLGGSGTIGGAVSILGGGIVAPGTSPGTLTVSNSFSLADTSILSFEFDAQNTTVGGGVNDLISGVTNLTLDGVLDVTGSGDWTTVANNTTWRLFDYSGTLVDNGLSLGSLPTLGAGQSFQIDTATTGQVNLVVVPEPSTVALVGSLAVAGALLARRRPARA